MEPVAVVCDVLVVGVGADATEIDGKDHALVALLDVLLAVRINVGP